MAPLESGLATFQSSAQQGEECSHRTHIDERQHESGLFRLQTSPQMKCASRDGAKSRTRSPLEKQSNWLPRIAETPQVSVMRSPVARKTTTEHLPCLSEPVFVDFVMCASRLSSAGPCNVSVSTIPLMPLPQSSSTSTSATASLFRMITDVWPAC